MRVDINTDKASVSDWKFNYFMKQVWKCMCKWV